MDERSLRCSAEYLRTCFSITPILQYSPRLPGKSPFWAILSQVLIMYPIPSLLQQSHTHGPDTLPFSDDSKTFGGGGFNINAVRINFNCRR